MIIAVHKTTKEHRAPDVMNQHDSEWRYVQADANGWISYDRWGCPISPDALVDVRTPLTVTMRAVAHNVVWGSVIAYRPILDTKPSEPEAPEWDGECLPPVGVECEINTRDGWVRATIVFSDGDMAIGRIHDGQHTPSKCDWSRKGFRPIRSEEDRAVDAISDAYMDGAKGHIGGLRAIYQAIRDGKIPGVKLTGDPS